MHVNWKATLATALCAAAYPQVAPTLPATLEIDTENFVEYVDDLSAQSDPSKIGTNPNAIPVAVLPSFGRLVELADIIAVNGHPAQGLLFGSEVAIGASPAPRPGQAIADTSTVALRYQTFQILQTDGTPVGSIMTLGFSQPGGNRPPGAPLAQTSQQYAIAGGTGAFLGARGQQGQEATPQTVNARVASMTEDPARRRINGGGKVRFILQVNSIAFPQIVINANGPALFHEDFSLVTAAQPAKAGEILIAMATGLGPTRPGVNPGDLFPEDPLQPINSPVEATINGQAAAVINAVGWPGLVDIYRVDVRVPEGIAAGSAVIRLSAAWIPGPSVTVPVR